MQSIATLTIDSREVATMIEKRHDHLIRDIKKYVEHLTAPNFGVSDFFQNSSYKDSSGKVNKCYRLTRKGCEFVANKMTGKKGILFTANYINRFHEMEQELTKKQARALSSKHNTCGKSFRDLPEELRENVKQYQWFLDMAYPYKQAASNLAEKPLSTPVWWLVHKYGETIIKAQDEKRDFMQKTNCTEDEFEQFRAEYFVEKFKK